MADSDKEAPPADTEVEAEAPKDEEKKEEEAEAEAPAEAEISLDDETPQEEEKPESVEEKKEEAEAPKEEEKEEPKEEPKEEEKKEAEAPKEEEKKEAEAPKEQEKKEEPPKEEPKPAATKAPAAAAAAPKKPQGVTRAYKFDVSVTKAERIGEGMSSYIVYQIVAKTSLPSYKSPDMSVARRFTDFFNLQRMLSTKYPGIIVPACPPKDAVGTGVVKFKSAGTELTPFIERRQHALQRFLRRLVVHPSIVDDELVHQFFETDTKMPKPKQDYVAMLTPKFPAIEIDEWFGDKSSELVVLEKQLRKLHNAVSAMCDGRKELSMSTTKFAESFAALADAEEMKQLTSAMNRLADVEARVAKFHHKQSNRDFFDFSEVIFDYILMIGSARVALLQRGEKLKASQNADVNLQKKKDAEAKAKAATPVKPEKVEQATKDVADAEQRAADAKATFQEIARICKKELERFDVFKVRDFQRACVAYIEESMNMEQLVVKEWESFLPEAKAISL
eukprot:m.334425 g.334425  ORF g.334425 m.334425 type:complete len:506 (+) comp17350_c0_seq1:223-1740(+)